MSSNGVERRIWSPLGWPRAGALVHGSQGPTIPIDCGNGEVLWVGDPKWGRQMMTALSAAVNQLEAVARRNPYPESRTESTAVIDAVTDDPQPEPGDQLVHPATTSALEHTHE